MIEAWIAKFETESILPGESIAHSVSSLPVYQALHELEDGHQCQAPGSESGLTMGRKQVSECLISVNGSQHVTYLHEHISTRKDRMSNTNDYFWNRRNRQRFE